MTRGSTAWYSMMADKIHQVRIETKDILLKRNETKMTDGDFFDMFPQPHRGSFHKPFASWVNDQMMAGNIKLY